MQQITGSALREAREKCGISAKVLASRVGISAAYLSQLELGRRGNPDPQLIRQLCAELSLDLPTAEPNADPVRESSERYSTRDAAGRASDVAALRAELASVRTQCAALTRLAESQAATIDRLTRGVCRYPNSGPTDASGADLHAG